MCSERWITSGAPRLEGNRGSLNVLTCLDLAERLRTRKGQRIVVDVEYLAEPPQELVDSFRKHLGTHTTRVKPLRWAGDCIARAISRRTRRG